MDRMDPELSEQEKREFKTLLAASTEIGNCGSTSIVCPRCGNRIIEERFGSGWTVRCQSDNCIKLSFRGI